MPLWSLVRMSLYYNSVNRQALGSLPVLIYG